MNRRLLGHEGAPLPPEDEETTPITREDMERARAALPEAVAAIRRVTKTQDGVFVGGALEAFENYRNSRRLMPQAAKLERHFELLGALAAVIQAYDQPKQPELSQAIEFARKTLIEITET